MTTYTYIQMANLATLTCRLHFHTVRCFSFSQPVRVRMFLPTTTLMPKTQAPLRQEKKSSKEHSEKTWDFLQKCSPIEVGLRAKTKLLDFFGGYSLPRYNFGGGRGATCSQVQLCRLLPLEAWSGRWVGISFLTEQ